MCPPPKLIQPDIRQRGHSDRRNKRGPVSRVFGAEVLAAFCRFRRSASTQGIFQAQGAVDLVYARISLNPAKADRYISEMRVAESLYSYPREKLNSLVHKLIHASSIVVRTAARTLSGASHKS